MCKKRTLVSVLAIAVVLAAIAFYFFVNPEDSRFALKCPVKLLTGFDCPSCGNQRALHYFLHGEFAKGLSYNYFLIVCLPYAFAALAVEALRLMGVCRHTVNAMQHRLYCAPTLYSYLVLYVAWWVLRNIVDL